MSAVTTVRTPNLVIYATQLPSVVPASSDCLTMCASAADDDGDGRSGYESRPHDGRPWKHDGWPTSWHDAWSACHDKSWHARAGHAPYEGRHGILWSHFQQQQWRRGRSFRNDLLQDTDVSRLAGRQMQLRRRLQICAWRSGHATQPVSATRQVPTVIG